MIKLELKRSLKNRWTLLIFSIVSVFCLIAYFEQYILVQNSINLDIEMGYESVSYLRFSTPYNMWFLFEKSRLEYIFLFLMPIFAVLPYGASYYADIKSGYAKQIITRVAPRKYYAAKYIATFVSGGAVTTVPVFIQFLLLALFLPLHKPFRFQSLMIGENTLGIDLFFAHPMIYTLICMLCVFIVSGVFATVGLFISLYITNFFSVILTPFAISFILLFVTYISGISEFSFMNSLQAITELEYNYWIPLIEVIVLFLITFMTFVMSRKETY